jgi:hypothetical protein
MSSAEPIIAIVGRSAEGDLAARVDDVCYIAIPADSGFRIATGWRLRHPIEEWTRSDVYGAATTVADEAGFRAHIDEAVEHRRQLRALSRRSGSERVSTPWGLSQTSEVYVEGIIFHSTASHGGIKLDRTRNAAMPTALRVVGGWYEEDAEWAKVAAGFPDLFTDYERAHADRTLREYFPECWEALHGRALEPGESYAKDRLRFHEIHARDWVVISAIRSTAHSGFVECVAALGGNRDSADLRGFLVPADEYRSGPHGFVIDQTRHNTLNFRAAAAA